MKPNEILAQSLWTALEEREWDQVRQLLHEDFSAHWPQSGERFNRDEFIQVNCHYPGDWHLRLKRVFGDGDQVVTEVEIDLDGRVNRALSFFRVHKNRIIEACEYWPEPFAVPDWRRKLLRRESEQL